MNDPINNPKHYNSSDAKCINCSHPIECIDVTYHMSFAIGNIVKYLWRYQHKDGVEGLRKARWYLNRAIEEYEKEHA